MGTILKSQMLAISGIQIVEHERKRERAKEKSEVRSVLGIFASVFFKQVKKFISLWRSFFLFWFRVFVNEFHNYFVQNVHYITLRL